jgi:trans-2,3-dihydro-3-hydroxyanthranilate isomerase
MEVPFAGHPTIGTAVALAALGHVGPMTLELGIGPIACVADPNAASFTTFARLERLASPDVALVAAALGLRVEEISLATHAPIQASIGLPFVLAEVADQVTLSRCQPDVASMRKGAALHPAGLDFAIFAYCREGDDVHARMFAPLDNIPEDPATGSAAATLAALLTEVLGAPVDLIIRQGTDMGRPSLISARTKAGDPVPVIISGKAVKTMEGRLVV